MVEINRANLDQHPRGEAGDFGLVREGGGDHFMVFRSSGANSHRASCTNFLRDLAHGSGLDTPVQWEARIKDCDGTVIGVDMGRVGNRVAL